ncbi:MAG: zinc-binding alcohol dehydrogenase [Candidatus Sumerlaeaceae bacterium]|nr:zinc-binding alcohol dehydrogenase [Candidatus Sumerlaeaceae bacterium]
MRAQQIAVKEGKLFLREIELGPVAPRHVRVHTRFTGVSAGTELALIRRNALERGAAVTLGYQAVGRVAEVGDNVRGLGVGDFVACYGAPYVSHANVLDVPERLCARLGACNLRPGLSFCGLGTIALHAVRLASIQIGDVVAVVGLGTLGNLVAQLAQVAGGEVYAAETNGLRRKVACECGIRHVGTYEECKDSVMEATEHLGADQVFLVTSACGNDLFEECAQLVRLRGRIIIVGAADAVFPRNTLFEKEATVCVARAGGPGRYDVAYETGDFDYPYAYVRWTEGRNLRAFVRLAMENRINTEAAVSIVEPVVNFQDVYKRLASHPHEIVGAVLDWGANNCEQ